MSRQPNSKFFSGNLVQKMTEDLQLIGRSKRTQEGYLRAVRKLAEFYQSSPDQISEQQVRRYFLTIKNVHHYAPGSLRVTPGKSKVSKTRNVPDERFVGGFVQHTLPRGFQKIRHCGWMSSNSKIKLDEVRWLVWLFLGNLNDPQPERKNYFNAKPEIAKRLLTLHNEWRKEVDGDGTAVPPKYVNSAEEVDNSSLESSYDD